ncbi:AI-2E family transporter [Sphingomonas histidinilytica]|jgi:predicted PurR-regulated permease PerM|uniref:Predicted PurR-regulated permease PerM n=1 Tax=Rhizorhabdus histidinilytica TaxID=439228 RepID=A0A1T5FM67_9SPHN|nr:AI-2E family transporter [Rhizorhabdus histidinilytica]MBO9380176.1 AI-2E family transporter [Rhizorhabdus histidinilytica]QEH79862.1 AI-2E family transporter [Sphingomonas sp. C8-2]SKB97260.1 Predicted PurR-regulated permease PerM [Rhizorhabdus histidinilytica]
MQEEVGDRQEQPVVASSRPVVDALRESMAGQAEMAYRRDRLLAWLALTAGAGIILAIPFALRSGSEFFLPVTIALVIAVAMVPLLEWLERRGLPSPLAALLCVIIFLGLANAAIASVIIPATEWFARLPSRIRLIRKNLSPLIDIYSSFERFVDETMGSLLRNSAHGRTVTVQSPNSLFDYVASSAPHALVQLVFATLVVYFFLSSWTRMRRRTITSRGSFSSAMTTARVIQDMVDRTSAYLATITAVNIGMGILVSLMLWFAGMPSPIMWGGLVAILNYVPYFGPIVAAGLLGVGGLMTFSDLGYALVPALLFVAVHLVEANVLTPMLVGRRLTINPLLILVALSFWSWVWGTAGALLAVPLLIILKTILDAAGWPDIAGFLFADGTFTNAHQDEEAAFPPEFRK